MKISAHGCPFGRNSLDDTIYEIKVRLECTGGRFSSVKSVVPRHPNKLKVTISRQTIYIYILFSSQITNLIQHYINPQIHQIIFYIRISYTNTSSR